MTPDERIKLPVMLQIYHTDVCGNRTHEGETDMSPDDWVFNNNADRWCQVACGDPESKDHENRECTCMDALTDFEFIWEKKHVEET